MATTDDFLKAVQDGYTLIVESALMIFGMYKMAIHL